MGTSLASCQQTPPGSYSPLGSANYTLCPPGTFNSAYGGSSLLSCNSCSAGGWCPAGSANPILCPGGFFNPSMGAPTNSSCQACTSSNYCPTGSPAQVPCPAGFTCPNPVTITPTHCAETCLCPLSSSLLCPAPIAYPMYGGGVLKSGWSQFNLSVGSTPVASSSTFPPTQGVPASSLIVGPTGGVTPTFANGLLYVGLTSGLLGLDSVTGNVAVLFGTPAGVSFTTAPVVGPWGYLHAAGSNNVLYAFDFSKTGAPKWTFSLQATLLAPPTICGPNLFFSDSLGNVYSVNAITGVSNWQVKPSLLPFRSSPTLDSTCTYVYIGGMDNNVYALSASSMGTTAWLWPTVGPIISSPVVNPAGTMVYLGISTSIDLLAMDTSTHQPAWQVYTESGGGNATTPALSLSGTTIYVGTQTGRFFAASASAPSNIVWSVALDSAVLAQATVAADGTVVVGTALGSLYALSPLDGSTLWMIPVGVPILDAPVITADGRVIVASHKAPSVYILTAAPASPSPSALPPAPSSASSTALSAPVIAGISVASALVVLLAIVWAVLKFVVWPASEASEEVGLLAPLAPSAKSNASTATSSSGAGEEGVKSFRFKKSYV